MVWTTIEFTMNPKLRKFRVPMAILIVVIGILAIGEADYRLSPRPDPRQLAPNDHNSFNIPIGTSTRDLGYFLPGKYELVSPEGQLKFVTLPMDSAMLNEFTGQLAYSYNSTRTTVIIMNGKVRSVNSAIQ